MQVWPNILDVSLVLAVLCCSFYCCYCCFLEDLWLKPKLLPCFNVFLNSFLYSVVQICSWCLPDVCNFVFFVCLQAQWAQSGQGVGKRHGGHHHHRYHHKYYYHPRYLHNQCETCSESSMCTRQCWCQLIIIHDLSVCIVIGLNKVYSHGLLEHLKQNTVSCTTRQTAYMDTLCLCNLPFFFSFFHVYLFIYCIFSLEKRVICMHCVNSLCA